VGREREACRGVFLVLEEQMYRMKKLCLCMLCVCVCVIGNM
jgi:hypothetical protein